MKAIINRQETFGTLNGVITKNSEILKVIYQHLKEGTAKLILDTEHTLMYELGEQKPNSYNYDTSATALAMFMNAQEEQKMHSPIYSIFNKD